MQIGGLTWDEQGKHYYYTGIDAVALYVWDSWYEQDSAITNSSTFATEKAKHQLYTRDGSTYTAISASAEYDDSATYYYYKTWYGKPVAWNGVTAINESPSGAESNKLYADNIEYLNLLSKEEFGLTLECYQTPKDNGSIKGFDECDGIITHNHVKLRGQRRRAFGLVYRVLKGSDTVEAGGKVGGDSNGNGYIYHIVYGCKASPSSRDFASVNDSPEAQTFSYEVSTTALTDTEKLPQGLTSVAHIEIDGSKLSVTASGSTPLPGSIEYLQNLLFNESGNQAMPTPAELAAAVTANG